MLQQLRRRLSFANVASLLALVIALGGTATAAALIKGKDVKNNSLTGKDVRNNSLAGKDIKTGSLRSSDIRNGALLARDFKAGQLPSGAPGQQGPAGKDGRDGEPGPAGPGSRMTSYLEAGESTYTAPAGTTKLLVRLWGGGGAGGSGNNWGGGGGGGQGGYVEALVPAGTGDQFTVTVGSGGVGGEIGVTDPPTAGDPTSIESAEDGALAEAEGGDRGTSTSACPNNGQPGGAGGAGAVFEPAIGLQLIVGETGGSGASDAGCGGGSGSAGGGAGSDGFPGSGGDGTAAGVFEPTEAGAPGAAVIIAYVD